MSCKINSTFDCRWRMLVGLRWFWVHAWVLVNLTLCNTRSCRCSMTLIFWAWLWHVYSGVKTYTVCVLCYFLLVILAFPKKWTVELKSSAGICWPFIFALQILCLGWEGLLCSQEIYSQCRYLNKLSCREGTETLTFWQAITHFLFSSAPHPHWTYFSYMMTGKTIETFFFAA